MHGELLEGLSMLSSVLQECLQEVASDPAPGGLPEGQGVQDASMHKMLQKHQQDCEDPW